MTREKQPTLTNGNLLETIPQSPHSGISAHMVDGAVWVQRWDYWITSVIRIGNISDYRAWRKRSFPDS